MDKIGQKRTFYKSGGQKIMSFLPFKEQFKIFFDKAKNRKEFRLIKKAESIDLFKIVASFK